MTAACTLLLISQVPVGRETLGRIMNVIGEPVDECGPIGAVSCDTCYACCFTVHVK